MPKTIAGPVHDLPADFRKAIDADAVVKAVWKDLTPLARNEWICWVTSASKDETRHLASPSASIKCAAACAAHAAGPAAPTGSSNQGRLLERR